MSKTSQWTRAISCTWWWQSGGLSPIIPRPSCLGFLGSFLLPFVGKSLLIRGLHQMLQQLAPVINKKTQRIFFFLFTIEEWCRVEGQNMVVPLMHKSLVQFRLRIFRFQQVTRKRKLSHITQSGVYPIQQDNSKLIRVSRTIWIYPYFCNKWHAKSKQY